MIDLSTSYMGIALKSPLVPSAAPLSKEMDTLRQMEDAGASAVVLYSLFEEQIDFEALEIDHYLEYGSESFAESLSYFPEPREFRRGPEEYLDHIRKAKEALDVPIIASLNGRSPGGWTEYSKKFEQAGADAIELNIYFLPTDPHQPVSEIEGIYGDIVRRRQEGSEDPGRGQAAPLLHLDPVHCARPGREGGGRAGAVQPLLPARHRPREPRGRSRTCSSRRRGTRGWPRAGWRSSTGGSGPTSPRPGASTAGATR